MKSPARILPVIVFAQFCCTSLWFAGNAILPELVKEFHLQPAVIGHLTSAVQLGFIAGTLGFAFLTISDRFSPSRVFFCSAILGAIFNLGILWTSGSIFYLLLSRFLTGVSLAGIYPVGMKIAADYFHKNLGRSLGYLVGALVLGTALPHLLKEVSGNIQLDWRYVIYTTSSLAILGAFLILTLIPDGPYRTKREQPDFGLIYKVFRNPDFRSAAFGYFGHMWELYAFWAFIPLILGNYKRLHQEADFSIPLMSFIIIAAGSLACVLSGSISEKKGVKKTAGMALLLSGLCCLLSPFLFFISSESLVLGTLVVWGAVVVADSPLFSTLIAKNTPPDARGTALTIVNSLGFAITILSIQLLNFLAGYIGSNFIYIILAIGPVGGLYYLRKPKKKL